MDCGELRLMRLNGATDAEINRILDKAREAMGLSKPRIEISDDTRNKFKRVLSDTAEAPIHMM